MPFNIREVGGRTTCTRWIFDCLNSETLQYWSTVTVWSVLTELVVSLSLGFFHLWVATEKWKDSVLLRLIPGSSRILKFNQKVSVTSFPSPSRTCLTSSKYSPVCIGTQILTHFGPWLYESYLIKGSSLGWGRHPVPGLLVWKGPSRTGSTVTHPDQTFRQLTKQVVCMVFTDTWPFQVLVLS